MNQLTDRDRLKLHALAQDRGTPAAERFRATAILVSTPGAMALTPEERQAVSIMKGMSGETAAMLDKLLNLGGIT